MHHTHKEKKAREIELEDLCINGISITLTNAEGYAVTLYLEVTIYLRHVTLLLWHQQVHNT